MKDRIPQDPGRVRIVPEGGTPFYAVMERADNPVEVGTPLNKGTLLSEATAALYKQGVESTPDRILRAVPNLINIDWIRLDEYTKAGVYNWEAPDLFNGNPYKIGVLVIGAGGSGKALVQIYTSGAANELYGGSSGETTYFCKSVVPRDAFNLVVGAGGESVTAATDGVTVLNGKDGGSSSFDGITAYGGGGGGTGGFRGGQRALPAMSYIKELNPFGGMAFGPNTDHCNMPMMCLNPFEQRRILGAGGFVSVRLFSGGIQQYAGLGGKDPMTGRGGGNGRFGLKGDNADDVGCGGGACGYARANPSSAISVTSGSGADGAVMIYAQGVVSG